MPYYKKSEFIYKSINTIWNQTYQKFEIIIIDDELSENSTYVLRDIKNLDKRKKF